MHISISEGVLSGVTFSATSGIIKITVSYADTSYKIEHDFADGNSLNDKGLNEMLECGGEFSLEITYYGGDELTVTPAY